MTKEDKKLQKLHDIDVKREQKIEYVHEIVKPLTSFTRNKNIHLNTDPERKIDTFPIPKSLLGPDAWQPPKELNTEEKKVLA